MAPCSIRYIASTQNRPQIRWQAEVRGVVVSNVDRFAGNEDKLQEMRVVTVGVGIGNLIKSILIGPRAAFSVRRFRVKRHDLCPACRESMKILCCSLRVQHYGVPKIGPRDSVAGWRVIRHADEDGDAGWLQNGLSYRQINR